MKAGAVRGKTALQLSSFIFLSWCAMNSIASESQYTFSGNRWNQDGRHLVGVFVDATDPGRLKAAVSIDTDSKLPITAGVVFLVEAGEELVFDGTVYQVKSIDIDSVVRQRLKDAYVNGKTLAPGDADVRDSVTIVRADGAASYGKEDLVLPQGPGVLNLMKSKVDQRLDLFLDEVDGKDGALRLRWNVGRLYGRSWNAGRSTAQEGPKVRVGEQWTVGGFGELKIIDVVQKTPRHRAWVILRFTAEP